MTGIFRVLISFLFVSATGSVCDFPSLEEVCRKVRLFEESFCHSMNVKFRGLDWDSQLAKVAIATCPDHQLSLLDYLEHPEIPEDLEGNHYEITTPLALYVLMRYMRRAGCIKKKMWRSLARDIVEAMAFEVAKELSRAYEFQIVMLKEFVAVKLLAAHAADCILEQVTIKPEVLIERNSALRAVLTVRPPKPDYGTTRFSVIVGERELKWDLFDVFKRPGVRREFGLFEMEDNASYESRTPVTWRFYVCHADCDPTVYGYRGLLLDWDYAGKLYRQQNTEKLYTEEVPLNFQDFTHQYAPFHRLVGSDPMRRYLEYLNRTNNDQVSFDRYIHHEYGYGAGPGREELFVYRPQHLLPADLSWELAVLENMDLTRLTAETFCCRRVRRSCLALAEYICGGREGIFTEECDLSYSSLVQLMLGPTRRCRMAYCALLDQSAPEGVLITDIQGKMMHMKEGKTRGRPDTIQPMTYAHSLLCFVLPCMVVHNSCTEKWVVMIQILLLVAQQGVFLPICNDTSDHRVDILTTLGCQWGKTVVTYVLQNEHIFCCVCFAMVISPRFVNPRNAFAHSLQGCITGTGAIDWLPQCQ